MVYSGLAFLRFDFIAAAFAHLLQHSVQFAGSTYRY